MHKGPAGIGGTTNTPLCMILETSMKALGDIGRLANTHLGMRVEIQRKALRVLAVPSIPPGY